MVLRPFRFGVMAALLALGANLKGQAPAATPAPAGALRFEPRILDFKRIREENGSVSGTVRVTNASDRPVNITKVSPSCGCTVAAFDARVLPPGEGADIRITFNPTLRQGKEHKPVWVESDDPAKPKADFFVDAEVIPRVAIEPRALWLGELKRGQVAEPHTIVFTARVPGFAIRKASSPDPRIALRPLDQEDVTVDGEAAVRCRYEVAFAGDKEVSILQSTAAFETTDPKMPVINVAIVGRVVGDLRLTPDMLNLRLEKVGEPFSQSFMVSSRSNTPFRVLEIRAAGRDDMKLEVVPEAPDARMPGFFKYSLRGVTPALDASKGNTFQALISLKLDIADQPTATIPVSGFVVLKPAAPESAPAAPSGR